jgi:hypothetical protein
MALSELAHLYAERYLYSPIRNYYGKDRQLAAQFPGQSHSDFSLLPTPRGSYAIPSSGSTSLISMLSNGPCRPEVFVQTMALQGGSEQSLQRCPPR